MSEDLQPRPDDMSGDAGKGGALQREKDAPEGGRAKPKRRRKVSYLTINKIDFVDYKDIAILNRFLNDRRKIIAARQSGNTSSQQRMISIAIRRAREMALIPFVLDDRIDRTGSARRERRTYEPRHESGAETSASES